MIRLKKVVFLLCLIFFSGSIFGNSNEKILITINKFVGHPAIDAVEQGIIKSLQDNKLIPTKVLIRADNAQGNITNSVQIARYHAAMQPKYMIAIATPSAQANFKAKLANTILAFAAVTDPKAAGIIDDKTKVIGVTDQPPVEILIDKALEILPTIKTIGLIFNPGEINSVKMLEQVEQITANKNIQVKKIPITSSSNVTIAMQKLVQEVDVIYLPQDNTVVSSIDNIIQISLKAKVPVIANDPSLVDRGLFLGVGADYFSMGRQLGNMIAELIDGKVIKGSIQNSQDQEIKINAQTAAKLAITVPNQVVIK